MPPTIQWYVRTALLYILVSAVLGVWYQLELWRPVFGPHPYLIVMHVHLALMGGVIQMIMGVGLWMFPLTAPIERRLPFRPRLAWATYALFNGGLLGRFVVEAAFRSGGGDLYGALTVLTGVLQVAALLTFVYHLWSLRLSRRSQAQH
ncbi:MAG TPA: hypothetical protein VGC20_04790 [bacterium]|jgi:hypothetical protein